MAEKGRLRHRRKEITDGAVRMRTYTLYVGKMAEAVKLYQEIGFPALQKGGQDKRLRVFPERYGHD
jgi:hypothetical protein